MVNALTLQSLATTPTISVTTTDVWKVLEEDAWPFPPRLVLNQPICARGLLAMPPPETVTLCLLCAASLIYVPLQSVMRALVVV